MPTSVSPVATGFNWQSRCATPPARSTGRKIELVIEDDKQDGDVARHAIGRLIERKVEASLLAYEILFIVCDVKPLNSHVSE